MARSIKYKTIKEFLGGDDLVKETFNNQYDLIRLARNGITKKQLLLLAKNVSLSLTEISRILPVSIRTLQRYKMGQVFTSDISAQILLIADLFTKGINVFGGIDKFNLWFRNPCTALSGNRPLDLLDTSFGLEIIKDELGRIEHGVIS
jgi:putative toxin-antitoxin system antitoxin component (TIGR02293 family)